VREHGRNAKIIIDGTTLTTQNEWDLSVERDYADVSVYGDGGKTYAAGLRGASGRVSGLLDVGAEYLLTAGMLDNPVTVEFYADATTRIAHGPAYVDVAPTASVSDAVRISATIRGSGTWFLN
jgi:hypothetical protein